MSGWWARSEGGGERGGGGSRVYRMIILTDMNAASDGGRGEGGWHPQARLCAGDKDAGERGTLESVGGGGACKQVRRGADRWYRSRKLNRRRTKTLAWCHGHARSHRDGAPALTPALTCENWAWAEHSGGV